MALHPRTPIDLTLAPVAAGIDLNLQRLRDQSEGALVTEIALELNQQSPASTRDLRTAQILAVALRNVDTHGWSAAITEDAARLHLDGGSVSLDLGLSAEIMRYIVGRVPSD